ncbi:MAG: ribosome maturation factor RimM [Bacillota bacterium]
MKGREERPERIKIAKVINTHGVRGEVKAIPLSDFPERFNSLRTVFLEKGNGYTEYRVESIRWHKNELLIKFEGIENPEQAEMLKNKYLTVKVQDTVPLPEDSFYFFEIVDLDVVDVDGVKLGTVQDILQTGANDVYVVQRDKGKELLIPALKKVVKQVDLEKGIMVVDIPPGLLDEEV